MSRTLRCISFGLLMIMAIHVLTPSFASTAGPHTRVRLIADTQEIVPGGRFALGILMSMDRGWHTYWKNPGEAGLPTTVAWKLPDGFVAGEIQWPVPNKYSESGDVLTYGYAGETMLVVPITAPAALVPGSRVTINATVEWLECEHTCVPGTAAVTISLPVVRRATKPDNITLFRKYRALLPVPFIPGKEIAIVSTVNDGSVEMRISAVGPAGLITSGEAAPDFYPEPLGEAVIGRTALRGSADGVLMTIPLVPPPSSGGPLRGILRYALSTGEHRAVSVELPLPRNVRPAPSVLDQTFETVPADGAGQPMAVYLLFAVLGGVLLNIMPCVLPVIALKVFGLVRMAGDQPARIKRLGWAFSSGILVSFLALALIVILLQLAGQRVGWGFQFQEPIFVIAMGAVVFAFGLNLFGVYEIQLPGVALNGISGLVARPRTGHGYGSSFAEGVFATVLATPCTAPFLGSALGFAFSQPWWTILLIFTSVALGMALPYLLLTARPAWLRFLPKPGEWMVTAKQFMGFLMMATMLWLLYILGKQLGMEAVIWTGAFLLAVGMAFWLVGRFATPIASRAAYRITWIAALLLILAGYYVCLESALNIRGLVAGTPSDSGTGSVSTVGIAWKPFTLAGLDADLASGKPVFVDFTAEWCLTCKVNEKTVINTDAVIAGFKSVGAIAIRADWTNRNPEITKLLSKFGRSGVPLYVIFPAGKPHAPIVLPEVITKGMVLEALERGAGR